MKEHSPEDEALAEGRRRRRAVQLVDPREEQLLQRVAVDRAGARNSQMSTKEMSKQKNR